MGGRGGGQPRASRRLASSGGASGSDEDSDDEDGGGRAAAFAGKGAKRKAATIPVWDPTKDEKCVGGGSADPKRKRKKAK